MPMSKSRIRQFKETLPKDPSRVYNETLPYIRAQVEQLSHLKVGTTRAKRVTRATLEAAILHKEAETILRIKIR